MYQGGSWGVLNLLGRTAFHKQINFIFNQGQFHSQACSEDFETEFLLYFTFYRTQVLSCVQKNTTERAPPMSRGRKSWNCITSLSCSLQYHSPHTGTLGKADAKQLKNTLSPSAKMKMEEKNICLCSLTNSIPSHDYSLKAGNWEVKALQFWGGSAASKFGVCYFSNKAWKSACLIYKLKTYEKLNKYW